VLYADTDVLGQKVCEVGVSWRCGAKSLVTAEPQ
jgi:hypothetical protein